MIELLVSIVVIGLAVWLIGLLPLPEPFPLVIKVVAIIAVIVMILRFAGVVLF